MASTTTPTGLLGSFPQQKDYRLRSEEVPYCAEEIQEEAIVCKHCGRALVDEKWRAYCDWYARLTPEQQLVALAQLSPEKRAEAERAWKALGYTTRQPVVSPQPRTSPAAWGCLVLILVLALAFILSLFDRDNSGTSRPVPEAEGTREVLDRTNEVGSGGSSDWDSFAVESRELAAAADCSDPHMTPPLEGVLGFLLGCIEGDSQTAKLFVNEEPGTGRVANVKVMWNDYFRDVGSGVHPDQEAAERLLHATVQRYAPTELPPVARAFFERNPLTITAGGYRLKVTHNRGPAIDEHLLIVTKQ
jgi:hypothetical protein